MDNDAVHPVQDIDYHALQALIGRVEHAIEHGLALEAEDMRLLLSAIHTLMEIQSRLEENSVTLHKLRKLLGMASSSEKRPRVDEAGAADTRDTSPRKALQKPRQTKNTITPVEVLSHALQDVKKGDSCPQCAAGKLQKHEPKVLLRVSGSSPFEAHKHVIERLKCNLCDYIVGADLPAAVLADGGASQQYGYSARTVMALFKHFSGIPYFHQETLNGLFGCPITASTIFDQCEYVANDCMPVYRNLKQEAANAWLFYLDDTTNHILDQKGEERPNRNGKGTRFRTGVYTSGLIAVTRSGHKIYLYNTNLGHAGEWLDDILKRRDPSLPPPIVMSDALSCNLPSVDITVVIALCNAHARRQFVDIENNYPDEVAFVLALYGQAWTFDHEAKAKHYNDQQRLTHHQANSLPVMEQIKAWCDDVVNAPTAEQHSSLTKACRYFLKHYEGLTQFCKIAGAPIDNNLMEEGLKMKIRSRKTSHYYKTQTGADVANVLTSIIATVYRNNGNPFDYLNSIQRHKTEVKAHPAEWLPWQIMNNSS